LELSEELSKAFQFGAIIIACNHYRSLARLLVSKLHQFLLDSRDSADQLGKIVGTMLLEFCSELLNLVFEVFNDFFHVLFAVVVASVDVLIHFLLHLA
jgi:hypothetical protein